MQTKDDVLAELMAEQITLKKLLGNSDRDLSAARCAGSDGGFLPRCWSEETQISVGRFIPRFGITVSKL